MYGGVQKKKKKVPRIPQLSAYANSASGKTKANPYATRLAKYPRNGFAKGYE